MTVGHVSDPPGVALLPVCPRCQNGLRSTKSASEWLIKTVSTLLYIIESLTKCHCSAAYISALSLK